MCFANISPLSSFFKNMLLYVVVLCSYVFIYIWYLELSSRLCYVFCPTMHCIFIFFNLQAVKSEMNTVMLQTVKTPYLRYAVTYRCSGRHATTTHYTKAEIKSSHVSIINQVSTHTFRWSSAHEFADLLQMTPVF